MFAIRPSPPHSDFESKDLFSPTGGEAPVSAPTLGRGVRRLAPDFKKNSNPTKLQTDQKKPKGNATSSKSLKAQEETMLRDKDCPPLCNRGRLITSQFFKTDD